ncbi:hypothetical protein AB5J55_42455 [Streptomyces sp. R11]|uniref:Uncharacterized protein n=1 Tax=Streptomyces sp. R11 TaxID=3238625 RepID=A0AB39NBH7_9ACTN
MQDTNVLTVSWLLTLKQIAAAFGDMLSARAAAGSIAPPQKALTSVRVSSAIRHPPSELDRHRPNV